MLSRYFNKEKECLDRGLHLGMMGRELVGLEPGRW